MQLKSNRDLLLSGVNIALFAANILGSGVYLYAVSASWAIPEERAAGITTVTGEPIVWVGRALPMLAGFIVLNLLWARSIWAKRSRRSWYVFVLAFFIWVLAIWFDFSRH